MTTTITVIYLLRDRAMCKEKEKISMLLPVLKTLERGKSHRECFDMWETGKLRRDVKKRIKESVYFVD